MARNPVETQRDIDLGVAYGLAHARDRELVLILPAGDRGTDPDPRAVLGRGICVVTYDDRV